MFSAAICKTLQVLFWAFNGGVASQFMSHKRALLLLLYEILFTEFTTDKKREERETDFSATSFSGSENSDSFLERTRTKHETF